MSGRSYRVELLGPARRAVAERLPEAVAAAVLEFCAGALAEDPHRVGKPLFGTVDWLPRRSAIDLPDRVPHR